MADPCVEITTISTEAHKWITKQKNVGEESLTDWILYEISQRIKKSGYIKFNRFQEARKTGADWEWWFIGNSSSLRLRVQAKKIEGKKDVYPSLAYTNKYGLQIEKLIKDSKTVNAIPIYSLYTAPSTTPNVKCKGKTNSGKGEGVFIADANMLNNKYIKNGRIKVSPDQLLIDSNPLSCLLCCSILQSKDPIKNLKSFFNEYFLSEEDGNQINNSIGLNENHPPYVKYILNNMDKPIPDNWELEFKSQIKEINAVMVHDLREPGD